MEVISTNKIFGAGAVLLITGFLIFQFGLATLLDVTILELGGNSLNITTAGSLLIETIGGIILLIGLLASILSITYDRRRGSYNTQQYLNKLSSDISALEKKVDNNTLQIVQLGVLLKESKPALSLQIPTVTQTPTPQVETSRSSTPTAPATPTVPTKDTATCKFCQTKIPKKTIFCPSCGRSQV